MTTTTKCPAWCVDHTGYDDGSDNWCQGELVEVGEIELRLSNGTLSGRPEVFLYGNPHSEGLDLDYAAKLGRELLRLVEAAS